MLDMPKTMWTFKLEDAEAKLLRAGIRVEKVDLVEGNDPNGIKWVNGRLKVPGGLSTNGMIRGLVEVLAKIDGTTVMDALLRKHRRG